MIALMAIWTGLTTFGVFYWALHYSGRTGEEATMYAQAMCFVNLLLIEKFTALSCRSERDTVFKIGFFGNKWLLLAIVGTMALSLPIIYMPSLQDYFHTYSLSLADWGVVVLASSTLFVVVEGAKVFWKWRERSSSCVGSHSPC
jgi:Ca2+-transporting ATPase